MQRKAPKEESGPSADAIATAVGGEVIGASGGGVDGLRKVKPPKAPSTREQNQAEARQQREEKEELERRAVAEALTFDNRKRELAKGEVVA